jgi:hypothetical protein
MRGPEKSISKPVSVCGAGRKSPLNIILSGTLPVPEYKQLGDMGSGLTGPAFLGQLRKLWERNLAIKICEPNWPWSDVRDLHPLFLTEVAPQPKFTTLCCLI